MHKIYCLPNTEICFDDKNKNDIIAKQTAIVTKPFIFFCIDLDNSFFRRAEQMASTFVSTGKNFKYQNYALFTRSTQVNCWLVLFILILNRTNDKK